MLKKSNQKNKIKLHRKKNRAYIKRFNRKQKKKNTEATNTEKLLPLCKSIMTVNPTHYRQASKHQSNTQTHIHKSNKAIANTSVAAP